MNGNPFTANFIGSTGQYPIFDYIKATSNVLQYNSSNFTKIKIDAVNTEINSLKATDASQGSRLTTVEGSAAASANAIIAQGVRITNIETWETGQTSATAANTTAIATINNTKLDKSSLDGGSVIYRDLAGNVQLSYDATTFKDVAVAFANRRLLTLSDTYYNLPTTKQDIITWNSPLSYDTSSKTASINLTGYLTSNVLSNVNINYGFLHSNVLSNLTSSYISSNVLSNITSFYISSNLLSNVNINYGFLHSNVLSNLTSSYISSNVLSNITSFYISSNLLSNVNINYGFLHSNVLSNLLSPYVSSNVLSNITSFYVASNVLSNVVSKYLPLSGGVLTGGLTVGSSSSSKDVNIWGNLSILAMPESNKELYVKGNITATNLIKASNLFLATNDDLYYGTYGTKIIARNNATIGHDLIFQTRNTQNGVFQDSMTINSSGLVGIGTNTPRNQLEVSGINSLRISDYRDTGSPSIEFVKGDTQRTNKDFGGSLTDTDWRIQVEDIGHLNFYRKRQSSTDGVACKIKNDGTIVCTNIVTGSIVGNNLVSKAPFIINATTSVSINSISGLYKYDLDISQYTGTFTTTEGFKMRYFKISTIYSNPAKYFNNDYANSYCFSQNIMITDSGGLTFFSPYTFGSWYGEFIGNDNYWMRNSFNYITFIHGHITDISNSNKKWYVIIEDLLS